MGHANSVEECLTSIKVMADACRAGVHPLGHLRFEMAQELRSALGALRDSDVLAGRKEFVCRVNELLRALRVRLMLPSGELCQLRLCRPDGGAGFIQFANIRANSRSRLGNVPIVFVHSEHLVRGRRSCSFSGIPLVEATRIG